MVKKLRLNLGFSVGKIIILSHLEKNELKTGKRLYEDLRILNQASNGLTVEYIEVEGIGDFLVQLERIFKNCKWQYQRPALHIECHGDQINGLVFCDGNLSWKYLGERIREINYATGNNLFVSLATCYGLNAYAVPLRHDRLCPAWYMIAPDDEVGAGRLLDFYIEFYSALSNCKDMDLVDGIALKHGVAKSVYSSRLLVFTVFRYLHEFCRGKGKAVRVEDMTTLSKWMSADLRMSAIRRNRAMAKEFFKIDERVFINATRDFLLYEEKAGCTWEDLKNFIDVG